MNDKIKAAAKAAAVGAVTAFVLGMTVSGSLTAAESWTIPAIAPESWFSPSTWGNDELAAARADSMSVIRAGGWWAAAFTGLCMFVVFASEAKAATEAGKSEETTEVKTKSEDTAEDTAGNSNHPAPTQEQLRAQAEKAEREAEEKERIAAEAQRDAEVSKEAAQRQRALVTPQGGGATHPKKQQQAAKA